MEAGTEPTRTDTEILVRSHRGAGISIKSASFEGQVEPDENGMLHFPADQSAAATHANEVFRAEEKAEIVLAERAQNLDQKKHGASRLEATIAAALGDRSDVAASMAAMMPAMMGEMRNQLRAETADIMAAQNQMREELAETKRKLEAAEAALATKQDASGGKGNKGGDGR